MAAKRILVVDDEDDIREVAALSLETVAGYEVLSARSGISALSIAASEQPDAILLDVMMPEMDGPTTFQKLQAQPSTSHIPVVFLTAKVQPSEKARFASLGASAVLSKPFDPLTLPAELADALGWPRP
ncbi:response regulator receiver protein [Candidatus Koribacter versatilis Ellin345]|uniref:Response regulator receiver protein n=1 Tax=Koribacter versatilis (strain Ellin345) TaxID=204669 RepID=Q1IKU5_KORVE|nr:response regulator [Candidatus Koribacter versatilis]ABF42505.1 response regulator receiver protein [Candidatus Koribacter versatilis Ellin345]